MKTLMAPLMIGVYLCGLSQADAATYYVRQGGDDSHTCSQAQTDTDANAKGTIQGGLDCPEQDSSGNTVIVHGGTYTGDRMTEVYSSSRGDSWSDANTLMAAPGETVLLTRRGDVFSVTDHINPRHGGGTRENRYWIIQGLTIDCQGSGGGGVIMDQTPHIRFVDVEVRDCQTGYIGGGDYLHLKNPHVHHIGNSPEKCQKPDSREINCYGIYYGGSHGLIEGGSWHDMGTYCLHLYSGAYDNTDVEVRDSKFCRCGTGGMGQAWTGPAIGVFNSGHRILNNMLVNNPGGAIWSSPGNEVSGNTVIGVGNIRIGDTETMSGNQVMSASTAGVAGGDVCAYDGGTPGPTKPPGKLPMPRNFRRAGR